ncbi:DUF2326 domain-containing protein [Gracilibacillus sp. YIM 98692]|uniref:DUF2326 domain-containing protein n=1 Tax=Gracilibacillus sp. YIM 98692 TaxID=2663532 RepID=UPI0013D28296|nr:DUF2326 domain-containing protein [Gracilibacillus sp. YIM 98692]
MILRNLLIYSFSEKSILKEYEFNEYGLNILMGERKEKGQETNGVGKTTMIESITYLLGGSCPKDFKGKKSLSEKDILLILEVKNNDKNIFLGRLINSPEKGFVLYSDKISFNLGEWVVKETQQEYKEYINNLFGEQNTEDTPAFSALREYIIRDEKKGFVDINLPNRNAANEASYFAYLFGLPHNFEFDIAKIKKEQKELNKKLGIINSLKQEIGDLKLKEDKIKQEIQKLDEVLLNASLKEKLKDDASDYSKSKEEYNNLQNTIFKLEHIKKQYQRNIIDLEEKVEEIKSLNDIEPFYEQLIGYFPDKIKKNHSQIQTFYDYMIENRGEYFKRKIDDINYQINEETKKLNKIGSSLSRKSLAFINTDIVSDISRINEEKNEKFEELADIRVKINLYQEKTEVSSDINKKKRDILRLIDLKQDIYNNYLEKIEHIENFFNHLVSVAYNETGLLDFELNNKTNINNVTGRIEISCKIDDEKSHGRLYMKINMFDLTWFLFGLKNGEGNIPFLIHDGSYSKPDRHAKKRLLEYVQSELEFIRKGQYFITINVDELEKETIKQFDKDGSIVAKLKRGNNDQDRFFGFRYTD